MVPCLIRQSVPLSHLVQLVSNIFQRLKNNVYDAGRGAQAVQTMLAGASKPAEGGLASLIGLGALLFAAIGVVVQLKDAFNTVWEVEE